MLIDETHIDRIFISISLNQLIFSKFLNFLSYCSSKLTQTSCQYSNILQNLLHFIPNWLYNHHKQVQHFLGVTQTNFNPLSNFSIHPTSKGHPRPSLELEASAEKPLFTISRVNSTARDMSRFRTNPRISILYVQLFGGHPFSSISLYSFIFFTSTKKPIDQYCIRLHI